MFGHNRCGGVGMLIEVPVETARAAVDSAIGMRHPQFPRQRCYRVTPKTETQFVLWFEYDDADDPVVVHN